MPGKFEAPRRRRKRRAVLPVLALAILALAAVVIGVTRPKGGGTDKPPAQTQTPPVITLPTQTSTQTTPPETTLPPSERVVAEVTLSAQGDLLIHKPIFAAGSAVNQDGTYDFSSLFRYMTPYTQKFDYAIANLETTLGGDSFPYQGNPTFNCHDEIVDAVKDAGYDMLLTANNHSYDTLMTGINRTLEVVRGKGLATLGTRLSEEETRYSIVEVNGIKLGMVCYTYTMSVDGSGKPCLNNGSAFEKPNQINFFSYSNLNKLYSQMEQILADMRADGAEATLLFIHWGTEYELTENSNQRAIAQKMCDLGVDVLIGGHPHVVQPMDLLESGQDPEHKMVCLYSMGNAVSNQRRDLMRLKTGHTEDGAMMTVTFRKFADGAVKVADTGIIPTWVNLHSKNGGQEYNILPLDQSQEAQWQTLFDLTDAELTETKNSYQRTMSIVNPGLEKCRAYLRQ